MSLAGARAGLACAGLIAALACAPIDVSSRISVHPRSAPAVQFGASGEELVRRDYVGDYVQLGGTLLVELRELRSCASLTHRPVMRIEKIHRSNRNFVIWDFVLGAATGSLAALAFSAPQLFSPRLTDGQGRIVYNTRPAYVTGAVFASISALLLTVGVVDAVRSRDATAYTEAYALERGAVRPCTSEGDRPLAEHQLTLSIAGGATEVHARSDLEGRARFSLPPWPEGAPIPEGELSSAVIEIDEARALALSLRVPYAGWADAHTGILDTRTSTDAAPGDEELP